jgi:hypothetical protein
MHEIPGSDLGMTQGHLACFLTVATTMLLAGCAEPPRVETSALGIVDFRTRDTPERTTVVGLDASHAQVAVLDIVHGRFTMSESFSADLDLGESPEVDGRKVYVEALGQKMRWEGIGYRPVLAMPPPPADQTALAAFVAEPAVKSVLLRWGIGFRSGEKLSPGEIAYRSRLAGTGAPPKLKSCDVAGTHPLDCQPGTPGVCWNGYNPSVFYTRARVCSNRTLNAGQTVHRDHETWPDADVHGEVLLNQCCTDPATGRNFFAVKSCTNDGLASGFSSCETCIPPGTPANPCHICIPCFEFDYTESCELEFHDARTYDSAVGAEISEACYKVE